jgi:hypothetical protein
LQPYWRTLRNTGSGTVVLTGTLTKNGSVLAFASGTFEVSGTILGSSPNSDLLVDGASVTLLTANSYNGPTYIRNAGTLIANVTGALPTATRSDLIMDDSGGNTTRIWSLASIFGQAVAAGSFQSVETNYPVTSYGAFSIDSSNLTGPPGPQCPNPAAPSPACCWLPACCRLAAPATPATRLVVDIAPVPNGSH